MKGFVLFTCLVMSVWAQEEPIKSSVRVLVDTKKRSDGSACELLRRKGTPSWDAKIFSDCDLEDFRLKGDSYMEAFYSMDLDLSKIDEAERTREHRYLMWTLNRKINTEETECRTAVGWAVAPDPVGYILTGPTTDDFCAKLQEEERDFPVESCSILGTSPEPIDGVQLTSYMLQTNVNQSQLKSWREYPFDLQMLKRLNNGKDCQYSGYWSPSPQLKDEENGSDDDAQSTSEAPK